MAIFLTLLLALLLFCLFVPLSMQIGFRIVNLRLFLSLSAPLLFHCKILLDFSKGEWILPTFVRKRIRKALYKKKPGSQNQKKDRARASLLRAFLQNTVLHLSLTSTLGLGDAALTSLGYGLLAYGSLALQPFMCHIYPNIEIQTSFQPNFSSARFILEGKGMLSIRLGKLLLSYLLLLKKEKRGKKAKRLAL